MSNNKTSYKEIVTHDEDDIEVQKKSIKQLNEKTNKRKGIPSCVISAGVGALLGLVLFWGPTGMIIGTVLGYFASKLKCSCCKCLLITTVALFIVFSLLVVSLLSVGYIWTKDVVEHLTVSTSSPAFPVIEMTDGELMVVRDRVSLFVDELLASNPPSEDLIVTQDEINGFIGHSDYLRGNMMVKLSPNTIREEFSLPVDMLPGGKNRYFVGSEYLKINKNNNDDEDVIINNTVEMEMETAAKHQDWFDGPLFFAQLQYLVKKKNHDDEGKTISELFLKNGYFFGHQAPEEQNNKDLFQFVCQDYHYSEDCEQMEALFEGIEEIVIEEGKIIVKPILN